MSDMTTAATVLAAGLGVAKPVVETGCKLIENLLGEPCKVAGAMLEDQLYAWQWQNRIRIAERANALLEKNHVARRVLPPGFLVPLLDAAGNVDDPNLQELWAQLVAAAVEKDENVHPMFVEALRSLSNHEAVYFQNELARQAAAHGDERAPIADARGMEFQASSAVDVRSRERLIASGIVRFEPEVEVVRTSSFTSRPRVSACRPTSG
jgi:hypothetical protein